MPPTKDNRLREEAAAAYRRTGSVREAAEQMGRSPSWVHTLLQEAGVDTSHKGRRRRTAAA